MNLQAGCGNSNSLPLISLDFLDEKIESQDTWEANPLPQPEHKLLDALAWLNSDDWQEKARGLLIIRRLAICNSEVLLDRLRDVSLAVAKEVSNLHSKVARFAINTVGELFRSMKKNMDSEVDNIAQVLLQKMGDSNKFIQEAASKSLGLMVMNVTPTRAMSALIAIGAQHPNVLVRKCASEHLLTIVEKMGAKKLLSGTCSNTNLLVYVVGKFAQDCHPDVRCHGRKMLSVLMTHPKFDSFVKRSSLSRDLEEIMARMKRKERLPRTKNKGLVVSVYDEKPETVKRYVLPMLWWLLGNKALPVKSGKVRAVITELAENLYQQCWAVEHKRVNLVEHALAKVKGELGKRLLKSLE
ncbi:TOG array regulator of axonemal microtubules protein 2 [Colius striatus]|uniref:TOG array regulator of axonemal microtubules protein 2 n=1 Tax=Colius striatus TaxID=57412 RepID=UPI002B1D5C8A|nr:TOG array regulator of axonemal microtubules protein 2 [Colius striatus]